MSELATNVAQTSSVEDATQRRLSFTPALAAVTLLGIALRVYGLPRQVLFGDDVMVAVSAVRYAERGILGPTMWNHPHLRDLLVYASTALFGVSKLPLVLVSLVLGSVAVPLLGVLARKLLDSERAALVAAFLLAIDPLHIDYSRQAVHEIYMGTFTVLAVLGVVSWRRDRHPLALAGAGVAFGLAIASKWYPAFPLGAAWLFLLRDELRDPEPSGRTSRAAFVTASLVVLPVTIYLLTFAPWFLAGHGLGEWVALQRTMAAESATHTGYLQFQLSLPHHAWSWFLWPSAYADFAMSRGGEPVVLLAVSNPLTWLVTLPAIGWLALRFRVERRWEHALLLLLFFSSWLPFVPLSRPIWLHSALGVLPFAMIAIGGAVEAVAARFAHGRRGIAVYACLVVLVTAPLYLLAIGDAWDVAPLRPLVNAFRPADER